MKKLIGTVVLAAMVAGAAFADVGIGAWGRGVWAPVAYGGNDLLSFEGTSWSSMGGATRVGITISGSSDNVGFNLDLNGDGGSAGVHDVAQIWVQPWEFLKFSIGKTQDDTGRGNGCYGAWDWHRDTAAVDSQGEDLTFTRFGNGGGGQAQGAIIKITPIENLWIIAAFNVADGADIADTYKQSQYGLGYIIDGIGHIRAQYIGKAANVKHKVTYKFDTDNGVTEEVGPIVESEDSYGEINAAFDLTAVENMYLTIGTYIPTNFDHDLKIAAYFSYNIGMPTIHALVNVVLNSGLSKLNGGVGLDLNFDSGVGLNFDVRIKYDNNASKTQVGFLAGVKKGFSNGYIGAGFEGNIYDGIFQMAIPVAATYWF